MKKRILIIVASLFSLVFFQCSKDDNGIQPPLIEPTFTDNIKIIQDQGDNLLNSLLAITDTASALDSVLKVFLKDTTVFSGEVSSQGISIKYKNGIIGGLLINPEDGEPLTPNSNNKISLIPADINSFSPTSKKTIFINPHYTERQGNANQIINLYNTIFPKIGYNPPITVLDNAATIDAMTNLAGYGIIHIYSHGWAYPKKKSITEVYLMTGEDVNPATNKKYENELFSGNIPVIKVHQGGTKYFLSPSFFSSKNNFLKDSTIVYGGFCYGFLGGWPNAMIDVSKAGAYTGFTWRVATGWNASLSRSIFDTLSNNSLKTPRTLDYWFTQTPTIAKQRWDSEDNLWCKIQYTGHSDLTLWSSAEISISPNPALGKPNESISFTAKSQSILPFPKKYKWNFGDGTAEQIILNDSTASHSFANEGTFTVTVKLLDQTDTQLSTASSQAIITAAVVTPNFIKAQVNIKPGYVVDNWHVEGKYDTGHPNHTLRDTSYSGTDTIGASFYYSFPITMSGNSFSGNVTIIDTGGAEEGITDVNISGSIDPNTNTASATISYSFSGTAVYKTYTLASSGSYSVNGVPIDNMTLYSYYFKADGLAACNYISTYSRSYVMAPIPPLGVTESGLTETRNTSTFWCYSGSEVTIYLSIY